VGTTRQNSTQQVLTGALSEMREHVWFRVGLQGRRYAENGFLRQAGMVGCGHDCEVETGERTNRRVAAAFPVDPRLAGAGHTVGSDRFVARYYVAQSLVYASG
jgi:hypothetical protein